LAPQSNICTAEFTNATLDHTTNTHTKKDMTTLHSQKIAFHVDKSLTGMGVIERDPTLYIDAFAAKVKWKLELTLDGQIDAQLEVLEFSEDCTSSYIRGEDFFRKKIKIDYAGRFKHECVAEVLNENSTDCMLKTLPTDKQLEGDKDLSHLTPDFILCNDKVATIIELKTTRLTDEKSLNRIHEEAISKYREASKQRLGSFIEQINLHAVLVSPTSVLSSLDLSPNLIKTLIYHHKVGLLFETEVTKLNIALRNPEEFKSKSELKTSIYACANLPDDSEDPLIITKSMAEYMWNHRNDDVSEQVYFDLSNAYKAELHENIKFGDPEKKAKESEFLANKSYNDLMLECRMLPSEKRKKAIVNFPLLIDKKRTGTFHTI